MENRKIRNRKSHWNSIMENRNGGGVQMENNQNNNEKQGKGKHYLIHNEYRPQSVRYLVNGL